QHRLERIQAKRLQSLCHRVLALAEMQAQRPGQAQTATTAGDREAAQHFLFLDRVEHQVELRGGNAHPGLAVNVDDPCVRVRILYRAAGAALRQAEVDSRNRRRTAPQFASTSTGDVGGYR